MNNFTVIDESVFSSFNTDISKLIDSTPSSSISNWQIAYIARELRHNNELTITCKREEVNNIIEQLSYFSNTTNITQRTINKSNSNQVYLAISTR